jgi:hypothetical protein
MRSGLETFHWKIMGWATACAISALTFLKLVANEVHRNQQYLDALEKTELEECKQRIKTQEEMLTVQAEPLRKISK